MVKLILEYDEVKAMNGQVLIIISFIVVSIIVVSVSLHLIRKCEVKKYRNMIKKLEVDKNLVSSTPVPLELSKVEPIIKNDKIEEKYVKWQEKFDSIIENELPQIDDMLIELDLYIYKKNA